MKRLMEIKKNTVKVTWVRRLYVRLVSDFIVSVILFYFLSKPKSETILIHFINIFNHPHMQSYPQYAHHYQIHGQLGDGGQATVYLASFNQQLFAVKVYQPGQSKLQAFHQEVDFLSKLKFKNLINLVDAKVDALVKLEGKSEEVRPIVVLEYASGGELFELIVNDGGLKPSLCRKIFKQLIQSIQFMEQKNTSHRDIKPENLLFDKHYNLKVSDFGLATKSEGENGDGILTSKVGTQGYKSPEMEAGKYTGVQADMFAAGVTLFIMYNGSPPFLSTKNTDKIYKHIKDGNFKRFWKLHENKKEEGYFSTSFKNLINKFFSYDPAKRPTFETLKDDEWMNQASCTQEELQTQLKDRYAKLLEENENKRKIQKVRLELVRQEIEQQNYESTRSISSSFFSVYNDYSYLEIDDLPQSEKGYSYSLQRKPSFVIGWLTEYLKRASEDKFNFMKNQFVDIEHQEYSLEFDKDRKQISIELNFFSEDDEIEALQIDGHLLKQKNKSLCIQWKKQRGNDFWLTSVIHHLNNQLKTLA